jgi:hypothetical protein
MASGQVGLRRVIVEKPFKELGVICPPFWDAFSLDTYWLDTTL